MFDAVDKAVYSVREVAELIGVSRQTVLRMFQAERGVIVIGRAVPESKRPYRTIRIPRAVLNRVLGKVTQ